MKKTLFIKNALILTVTSLLLRFAGIIFKVWLAQRIGSEGIGLYQIVFSVYVLASTFAISGTSTAVTRLVTEELALQNTKGALKILRRAIQISLIIAFLSVAVLYFGADYIGNTVLGDQRTVLAVKILPLSLPFIAISSCIRGYFIARRKITPNALSQIFEQAVRIVIILLLVSDFYQKGLAACCFAVILGDGIAEALSCILLYTTFVFDKKKLKKQSFINVKKPTIRRLLHISVPITLGRYLNTGLRTAENILVPKNLAKYPKATDSALSQFGMIKGMALPILFFPSAILNAVSTLLIPEISEAVALNQNTVVQKACERIFKITLVTGIIFGAIFFTAGGEIAKLVYNETDVGFLLKALSPIVPLMYLDSISDGILKGLDQQGFTFRTAVTDSTLRLILILLLLSKTGLMGFILIMYFSNFLTCFLNVRRLLKISKVKINFAKSILLPTLTALCCTLLLRFCLFWLNLFGTLTFTVIFCLMSVVLYIAVLSGLKVVKKEDFWR